MFERLIAGHILELLKKIVGNYQRSGGYSLRMTSSPQ